MARTSELARISRDLSRHVEGLEFSAPITHVYNPLDYARAPHEQYLERFGKGSKQVLFVGMNPGPFGMAQTGVPFGDVSMVRDWMGIEGKVARPETSHEKRPIWGFDCPRGEVSGARLWGWAKDRFGTPERFFERFFVVNYCPLCFMVESGKNFTPDKLPAKEREDLFRVCDIALAEVIEQLHPEWVIGVGAFALKSALRAVKGNSTIARTDTLMGAAGSTVEFGTILHPSPASPRANRGWAAQAEAQLEELGIELPDQSAT